MENLEEKEKTEETAPKGIKEKNYTYQTLKFNINEKQAEMLGTRPSDFNKTLGVGRFQDMLDNYNSELEQEYEKTRKELRKALAQLELGGGSEADKATIDELRKEIDMLQEQNQRLAEENKAQTAAIERLERDNETLTQATNANNDLAIRLQKATMDLEALRQQREEEAVDNHGTIRLRVEEPVRKMLDKLVANLTERYQREVKLEEILVKSCLQYNVERRTLWFYPYLTNAEIEESTGIPVAEWKKFLNKK